MPQAEVKEQPAALASDVFAWRMQSFLDMGYAPAEAELMACNIQIDLHDTRALVDGGCPLELALEILL